MSGRYERECVNILTGLGYGAVRIPSSGSATDRDLPDVLAGEPATTTDNIVLSNSLGIEHKSGSGTTLYVKESEVEALTRFCDAFGASPMLAARYTTVASDTAHYLVEPENARGTPEGHYGLPVDDIEDRASLILHPNDA